ncbi:hypothetical protein GUITHDRAFT_141940 [Guillardia theta CCMP2712]|uniref:WW domain-containing protein n=1 Tax=Guillardia theta (strain CCMP2712) TaxID=905079 RepID=L1J041_GUITC|nr:hypothetical protein GUITHDRAFT_141940 [Guillardia theta CCMP2712]EKX41450.1 hypothetical protein GUITHDRAFT_141940 [Guillardia theta CCMP2712]|eukprot:XP_005828430.1 hypothetical protein GUITHDRAFT_141940 [Guillardia theta CCMP2712]
MTISMKYSFPLLTNEIISLHLPGFRRMQGSGLLGNISTCDASFRWYWDECQNLLTLVPSSSFPQNQVINCRLYPRDGLQLPEFGVITDSKTISISTNAVAFSYMFPTITRFCASHVGGVGSITNGPGLQFVPGMAGVVNDMYVTVNASATILPMDSIIFEMSDFVAEGCTLNPQWSASAGCAANQSHNHTTNYSQSCTYSTSFCYRREECSNLCYLTENCVQESIVFQDCNNSCTMVAMINFSNVSYEWNCEKNWLKVIFDSPIEANREKTVKIPSAYRIRLPLRGITPANSGIKFEANFQNGKIDWTPVKNLNSVGALRETSLRFDPPVAGYNINITFQFIPDMPMVQGDLMLLRMSYFDLACDVYATENSSNVTSDYENSTSLVNVSNSSQSSQGQTKCFYSMGIRTLPENVIEVLRWVNSEQTLYLQVNQPISAGQHISLTIPSAFGFKVPRLGIQRSSNAFQVSADAKSGMVVWTPIEQYDLIGAFVNTSLDYGTPGAAQRSSISIAFSPVMAIMPRERVTFILPNFLFLSSKGQSLVPLPTSLILQKPLAYFSDFFWSSSDQSIQANCLHEIPAGLYVQLTIDRDMNVSLPMSNLALNDPALGLSSNTTNGPVLFASFERSPVVSVFGNITNHSLSFSEDSIAHQPVEFEFEFAVTEHLQSSHQDELVLHLPGFSSVKQTFNVSSTPAGLLRSAVWTQSAVEGFCPSDCLKLAAASDVPAETLVRVLIPLEAGMTLPVEGVRVNDRRYTIASTAISGPVRPTPFHVPQGVGSFGKTANVTFYEGRAGEPVAFALNFVAFMPLGSRDQVLLRMDSFGGDDFQYEVDANQNHSNVSFNVFPPAAVCRISWNKTILNVSICNDWPAGQRFSISIPRTWGIILPPAGLRVEGSYLWISSNAFLGVVRDTPVVTFTPVGALEQDSLQMLFEPMRAAATVSLTVRFHPLMSLETGDLIVLHLPSFFLVNTSSNHTGNATDRFSFSWDQVSFNLSARLLYPMGANITHDLIVPSKFGLALPREGVRRNQDSILFNVVSTQGNILPRRFDEILPVGAFVDGVALRFDPLAVGQVTSILISFQVTNVISINDTFIFYLPRFFSQTSHNKTTAELDLFDAVWDNAEQSLSFVAKTLVSPYQNISLLAPPSMNISIPLSGLPSTFVGRVRADVKEGPILLTPVKPLQTLGAFRSSSITFVTPRAGKPADVVVMIRAYMMIGKGDVVMLKLSNFEGPGGQLAVNSSSFDIASWNSTSGILSMTASRLIPAGEEVSAVVVKSDLLLLPSYGISLAHVIQISSNAFDGPAPWTKVDYVQPVGSFLFSEIAMSIHKVGQEVALSLSFNPTMEVMEGSNITFKVPSLSSSLSTLNCSLRSAGDETPYQAKCTWRPQTSSLQMEVYAKLEANSTYQVQISSLLFFGEEGISYDDESVTIACDSPTGPVLPTRIIFIPSIHSYGKFTSSKISYQPRRTDVPVVILFSFAVDVSLYSGDVVTLHLPKFLSSSTNCSVHVNGNVWTDCNFQGETLSFTVMADFRPNEVIVSKIASDGGIMLPSDGIRLGDNFLKAQVQAIAGSVALATISSQDPVGTLNGAALTFSPAQTSQKARLMLSFQLQNTIQALERLTLQLPEFSSDTNTTCNLSAFVSKDLNYTFRTIEVSARWRQSSSDLVIEFLQTVLWQDNKHVTIVLPQACGIHLPPNSVAIDLKNFTIASNALYGPVDPTPLQFHLAIGKFSSLSLSFGDAVAGEAANLTLRIASELALARDDVITVYLPGFRCDDPSAVLVPDQSSVNVSLYWLQNTCSAYQRFCSASPMAVLSVKLLQDVASNQEIVLEIVSGSRPDSSSNFSIFLPPNGVRTYEAELRAAVNSKVNPIYPSNFDSVQPVGYLGQRKKLKFAFPARANQTGGIQVEITPAMDIQVNDEVFLFLPQFLGPSFDNKTTYDANHEEFALVSWDAAEMLLRLVMKQNLKAGNLDIPLPSDLGVILPAEGLKTNETALKINAAVVAGSVRRIGFDEVQAVGAFQNVNFDFEKFFSSFSCYMTLWPGDELVFYIPTSMKAFSQASFDSSCSLSVTFYPEANQLKLKVDQKVTRLQTCEIVSSAYQSFTSFPALAETFMWVEVEATEGYIPPTRIDDVITKNPFIQYPVLSLHADPLKRAINISFVFTLDESFFVNTTVTNVTLIYVGAATVTLEDMYNGTFIGNSRMPLSLNEAALFEEQAFQLQFPILSQGLWRNQNGFWLTFRKDDQEFLFPCKNTPFGGFAQSELKFDVVQGKMNISVVTTMDLVAFDSLFINLNTFSSDLDVISVASDPPGICKKGLWDGSGVLVLVMEGRNVSAGPVVLARRKQLTVILPLGPTGLRLPKNGVRSEDETITVGSNASLGPTNAKSFGFVQPVGCFRNGSSVEFFSYFSNRSLVGNPVGLRISFKACMKLLQNDAVYVKLPGFYVDSKITPVAISGSDFELVDFQGDVATFVVRGNVTEDEQVVLEVLPSVGFRLPLVGVRLDDVAFNIATNAFEGPVQETSFDKVQAVGSFTSISLSFAPDSQAGRPVNVTLNFTAAMDILQGENVSLLLPGWQAEDFMADGSLLTLNNTSIHVILSWAQTDGPRLTMSLADRLPAAEWAQLQLTRALGLVVLPSQIQHNLNAIVAFTNARLGVVNFFPVDMQNKIGAFLDTKIEFSPAAANIAVEFTISFVVQMDILAGENIHFLMRSLKRIKRGPVSVVLNGSSLNVSSWDSNSTDLVFQSPDTIYALDPVTFRIQLSEGFVMSPLGLAEEGSPKIYTDASNGFVNPIEIEQFPLIARIFDARLVVVPLIADFDADVSLELTLSVPLLPGDVVRVHLPGFSEGRSRAAQPLNASLNYSVSWNESDASISWTMYDEVPSQLPMTLAGPSDMYLRTSKKGLLLSQQDNLIELRAAKGNVMWSQLTAFDPFGALSSLPRLALLNPYPQAEATSGLQLDFQLSMDLVPGDSLRVFLPGFRVPKNGRLNVSSATIFNATSRVEVDAFAGSVSNIFYHYANYEVVMLTANDTEAAGILIDLKCEDRVFSNSSISIQVGDDAEVSLPHDGVKGIEGFAMSVNASDGPVLPSPFASVQSVGILSNTSMIFGDLAAAGEIGNLTLSFSFSFNLSEGDKIVVRLPAFFNLSSQGTARLIAHNELSMDIDFHVPEMYVLEFTLPQNALIPPASLVSVSVVEEFVLPPHGVAQDSKINMTVLQGSSSITFSNIQSKQPVGAVLNENILFDCPNAMGAVGFTLSFLPTMSIQSDETVAVFLRGFYAENYYQLAVASSQVQQVTVEPLPTGVRVIFAVQALSAGSQATLRADVTLGIKPPNASSCHDRIAVILSVSAASGPVRSKALSSVVTASVRSHAPAPGETLFLSFEMLSTIQLRANDTMMLVLPPFDFASTASRSLGSTEVVQTCGDTSATVFQSSVLWDALLSSFVLKIPVDVQSGSRLSVNISGAPAGLKFPLQGIPLSQTNQFSVKIQQESQTYISCLGMLTPFGAFLSPTNVTFTSNVPGSVTGFQITMEMSMNLYQNDRIEVFFDGFDIFPSGGFRLDQRCMVVYCEFHPFSFIVSAERKAGGVLVAFMSNQFVAGFQKLDLSVPVEGGLTLPRSEAALHYSVNVIADGLDGTTRNHRPIRVPRLGSFLPSYLTWNSTGKETADIRLFFTPHIEFQGGETVSLRMLPFLASSANVSADFHFCDKSFSSGCRFDSCFQSLTAKDALVQCCGCALVHSVPVTSVWNTSSSSLTFAIPSLFMTAVNRSDLLQLTPCSLHIPQGTFRYNSTLKYATVLDFTLSTDSKTAPVLHEPIQNVSAIGDTSSKISVGHYQGRDGIQSIIKFKFPFRLVSSTNFSALVTTLEPSRNVSYYLNVTEEVFTLEMYNQTYFNTEEIAVNLSMQESYMDVCFGNLSQFSMLTERRNFTSSTTKLLNRTNVQNMTQVKTFTMMTDPVVSTNLTAIKHNDTIVLHLPELSGLSFENVSLDVLCLNDIGMHWDYIPLTQQECQDQVQSCTCQSFGRITAEWDNSLHLLSMTVYGNMSGDIQVQIPDRLGFILLPLVSFSALTDAWIQTERIPFFKLTCEKAVNATVLEASMEFGQVSAGEVAEIFVVMSLSTKMKRGDNLYISMPEFNIQPTNSKRSPLIVNSQTWKFLGYWEAMCNFSGINIVADQDIPPGTSIHLTFPKANGIMMPVQGVLKNSFDIQLSMVTSENSISNVPFKTVQPVGSFAKLPVIQFFRVNSSEAALFNLNVTFHMPVRERDVLELVLPGFSCSGRSCQTSKLISILLKSATTKELMNFSASWTEASKKLRILFPLDALPEQEITFESTSPMLLPDVGVSWEGSGISISLNSTLGPIEPTLVQVIPIGSVRSSAIAFVPAVANSPSRIILTFIPGMDMKVGDLVELGLPQFLSLDRTLPKVRRVVCTENVCVKIRNGVWDENAQLMTLTVLRQIVARELVTFEIPFSFGLCLPEKGFRADSSNINITILSNSYVLVGPIPLGSVQPVGGFVQASVTFNPNIPNVKTNIVLRFIPSARQLRGRSLFLTMPGFSNTRLGNFSVTSFPASFVKFARWSASTFQLQFFIENDVPEMTQIVLSIDADVGFQIPSDSMQTSLVFKLQSDMPDGQMPQPLPIRANLSSGQLFSFSSSKLSFRQKYAGKPTSLFLEFSTALFFVENDQLLLLLPGFTRRNGDVTCKNITTTPSSAVKLALWIQKDNTLVLNISTYFEENKQFQILVSDACGIELPFDGVSSYQSGIKLSAVNAAGQIGFMPLSMVEPVGSFGYSTELHFAEYGPQRQVKFSITFSPKMGLSPGDELIVSLPGFVCNRTMVNLSSNKEGLVSVGYWRQYEVIEKLRNGTSSGPIFQISEEIVCENRSSVVEVRQSADPWCVPKVSEIIQTVCWNISNKTYISSQNSSFMYDSEIFPKHELTIPILHGLDPCQVVTLQIVNNDSFYLPLEGVRANDANLTLRASAVAGNVPATPFVSTMAVGAESTCDFGFFPQTAGRSTQLEFSFSSMMPLSDGDLIVLRVPGLRLKNVSVEIPGWKLLNDAASNRQYFLNTLTKQSVWASDLILDFEREYSTINEFTNVSYGVVGSQVSSKNASAGNLTNPVMIVGGIGYSGLGTWCPLSEELTVLVSNSIQAGVRSTFKIEPFGSTFVLPDKGFTPDNSVFFKVVSKSGNVQESSCKAAQITAFVNSSLETFVNQSNQFSEIHIKFTASVSLQSGDILVVSLPQFTRMFNSNFELRLSSGNQHWFCAAEYIQDNFTLYVNNSILVQGASAVEMVIPENLGFKIPRNGIRVNDTRFLIGLKSSTIGIPLTVFRHVTPVGTLKFSSVTMLPIRISEDVELNISFSPFMNLDAGSLVRIEFPQFAFQPNASYAITPDLSVCPDFQVHFKNDTIVDSRLEFTIRFQFNSTIEPGNLISIRFMNQSMKNYEFQLSPSPLIDVKWHSQNSNVNDPLFVFNDYVEPQTDINMTFLILTGQDKFYIIPPELFEVFLLRSTADTCQNSTQSCNLSTCDLNSNTLNSTNVSHANHSSNASYCDKNLSFMMESSIFTSVSRNLKSVLELQVLALLAIVNHVALVSIGATVRMPCIKIAFAFRVHSSLLQTLNSV